MKSLLSLALAATAAAAAPAPWGALYQRASQPSASLSFLRLHAAGDVRNVPLDCGRVATTPTSPSPRVWEVLATGDSPTTNYVPCFAAGSTVPQSFLGIDADGFIDSWAASKSGSTVQAVADARPEALAASAFAGASLYPSLAVVGNSSSSWAVSAESPNVVFDYLPTEAGSLRGAGWPVQGAVVLPSAVVSLQRRVEAGEPVLYIATKEQVYSYGVRTESLQLLATAPAGHEYFAVLAPQMPGETLVSAPVVPVALPAALSTRASAGASLRGAAQ